MPAKKGPKKQPKKRKETSLNWTLVELIANFVTDKDTVREDILFDEQKGLEKYVSPANVLHLRSYDPDLILCELHKELLRLHLDVKKKGVEVRNNAVNPDGYQAPQDCTQAGPCHGTMNLSPESQKIAEMMFRSAYQSGGIHPRRIEAPNVQGVELKSIKAETETEIVIAGNGLKSDMEVHFVNGTLPPKTAVRGSFSNDIDLYQRLTVKVTLPLGNWKLEVRLTANDPWTIGETGTRPLYLEATP